MMKLVAVTSVAFAVVSARSYIQDSELDPLSAGLGGRSDNCEGCDVAPTPIYECLNPPCDKSVCGRMPIIPTKCDANECSVDCDLEHGYYPDKTNCQAFCFCSGTNNVDTGTGIRVPSKYAVCPEGTVYNPNCEKYHASLANGLGWHGGCCTHPRNVMNFPNCPNGCRYLSQWHCGRSETCCWNKKCNCCLPCTTTTTEVTPTPTPSDPNIPTEATTTKPPTNRTVHYNVYPQNDALGHKYGLVFLLRDDSGENKDGRRFLYGYVDGEFDQSNNLKEGYRAYRCQVEGIDLHEGIDLRAVANQPSRAIENAVAINGCKGLTKVPGFKSKFEISVQILL